MNRREFLQGIIALAISAERAAAKSQDAVRLIQSKVDSGELAGAVLEVCHRRQVSAHAFGIAKPSAVFYLASLTKPMTATAVMLLADRGKVSLEDPVQKFIPEFRGGERERVLLRHLLIHTSGLPDLLPENEDLRKRHAPLKDFVAMTCQTPLLFSPGTRVSYQSMGILLAGEIVERVSGHSLRDFLRDEVFQPLQMRDSSLGLGGRKRDDTMQLQHDAPTDWAQNSPYWRNLGAPWGGVHATAADVRRFTNYFLHPDASVLKPATAAAMLTNQTQGLNRPWGIGWAMSSGFGKHSSARACGHSGSSGTLTWLDPEKDLSCVLLTTLPARISRQTILDPVSDLVSDAG